MKKLLKITLIVSISILFIQQFTNAQAVKYSNEFLAIGVGGRALGISKATIATVSEPILLGIDKAIVYA